MELTPNAATTIATTLAITAVLAMASLLATRHLALVPGTVQTIVEGVVDAIRAAIAGVLPEHVDLVLPFVGTLWIFLALANLAGVIPGVSSPTADLSTTAALAVLTFCFVHWAGIRSVGLREYLLHYLRPNPIMLPFEIISELSRTLTLAVRLFGNMMSLELAALIVLGIAGFLVPIPLLLLHIVEALIQAYIFGMLALVYVAGAIQTQHERLQKKGSFA
ncbi:MAG TPA: F0F1 ATP synthase subunit A [Candidatus Acidoferrales bacterium]|nr:F0F1 ATP synthase subunit A [Candidatus Acidoferrales bacterium]